MWPMRGQMPLDNVRTFMPHKKATQSTFRLIELSEEDWWLCSTSNMCVSCCPRGVIFSRQGNVKKKEVYDDRINFEWKENTCDRR